MSKSSGSFLELVLGIAPPDAALEAAPTTLRAPILDASFAPDASPLLASKSISEGSSLFPVGGAPAAPDVFSMFFLWRPYLNYQVIQGSPINLHLC